MRTQVQTRRKGLALLMALVAMATVTVLITVIGAQIVAQRSMARQRQRQLQAEWATRAGVEWATARLLQSAESFKDDKQELAPDSQVNIIVEKKGDEFTVRVDVQVGMNDPHSVKRDVSRRLRRVEKDGRINIEIIALEK
jgi:type II secretory pathway component PulK